jgi:anti-anti-sigma factor
METTIRKDSSTQVTVILDGRLDTLATQQAEVDVEPLYNYSDVDVIIDCSHLDYISSSGLRLFMSINQHCRANHCSVYITGIKDKVRDVFQATGFVHLFQFK